MATVAVVPGLNSEIGEAQRLFAEQAAAGERELNESGQLKPFTVINFNPVPVGLQGELKRYKVWTPEDGRLPEDVFRLKLPYEDKEFRGHGLTVRFAHKYGQMTGATGAGAPGEVIAQRTPKYFTPQAIAYSFMEHYSPIFASHPGTVLPPAPKDARRIFGLLVFEGDIHVLERILEEEDPAKRMIRTPVCHLTTIGKTNIKSYRTVEISLDQYLAEMFTGQRKFCDATLMRAHQKWSDTQSIADISDVDRTWYRWAIKMGYAQAPAKGEKTWLSDMMVLTGGLSDAKPRNLRKCQSCRAEEPEEGTPFCPKCMAPINTFTTFMAGFPVADAWLQTLKGEERELALVEKKLREQGFDEDSAPRAPQTDEPAQTYAYGRDMGISTETLNKLTIPELVKFAVANFKLNEEGLSGIDKKSIIAEIEASATQYAAIIPGEE